MCAPVWVTSVLQEEEKHLVSLLYALALADGVRHSRCKDCMHQNLFVLQNCMPCKIQEFMLHAAVGILLALLWFVTAYYEIIHTCNEHHLMMIHTMTCYARFSQHSKSCLFLPEEGEVSPSRCSAPAFSTSLSLNFLIT